MGGDDGLDEGEAEAGAAGAGAGGVAADEALEGARGQVGWEARSVVVDGEAVGRPGDGDGAAVRGVLAGVGQQVGDDLVQPRPVTVGLCYSNGFLPMLRAVPNDLPLDALMTDDGVSWQRE